MEGQDDYAPLVYPSLLLGLCLHITVQPAGADDSEDSLIQATEALDSDLE